MKQKILFLAAHFTSLYFTRRELIEELADRGYDIYISIPESDDNRFFTALGCTVIPTEVERRGTNPLKDLLLIFRYRRIIRKVKPDVILSYEIKPNIYGALGNRFLKNPETGEKYKQICNITGTGATFLTDDFICKLCKILYRISLGKNPYLVFFQNAQDRDFFVKNRMVGKNNELLPGSGVNLYQFPFRPMPKDDTVKFIFIARVMRVKGIHEYLHAARRIKEEYPHTRFFIAGWNEEENYMRLVDRYEDEGVVEYLGFTNNIISCIDRCHCTVLPSHGGEGVPNVLLESSAMGRACIGSKIPGTVDVIDDGKTGFLFEAKNDEDLMNAIRKFLALSYEEKARMGKAGRERMERLFDRNLVINTYLRKIERAVGKNDPELSGAAQSSKVQL